MAKFTESVVEDAALIKKAKESLRETLGYAGSVSPATKGYDVTIKRDEILRMLEEHRETIKSYGVKRLG